eukprot:TRINITY_DN6201_c0_g1_i1.p1 TRINITY_DN6201_c0_g1~~TRINITY_DN6201_c0_g1_i1.p1  ORF type:complete len:1024 (+),score=524.00 TRINITY_DN6201_c0_g1_i1:30-3101(+)
MTFRKKGAESDLLRYLDEDPDSHIKAKVWVRWINHVLKTGKIENTQPISDLRDLRSGLVLCQLSEILSNKEMEPKYITNPTLESEFITNVNSALRHFRNDGMPVTQFPSSIFLQFNQKSVTKFVWNLIRQYSDDIGDFGLARWCNRRTAQFDVFVEDWRESWKDGRAFAALAKYFDNEVVDDSFLKLNRKLTHQELQTVFSNIESRMNIHQLVEPEELENAINPEEILTTYIMIFYHQYGPPADFRALEDKNKLAEKKLIRLEIACRDAHKEIQKRSQQLARANTELKYMVGSQKEVIDRLNQQRDLTAAANERITGLEMKISFYLSPAANIPVPAGPVCVVMTQVIDESAFWDLGAKTTSKLLGLHNSTLLEMLERTGGYIAGSDGGSFTLAFIQSVSALRFCALSQKKLLAAEWPEEIFEEEEWVKILAAPEGQKELWRGPKVAMAIKYLEPVHYTEPTSGRVTFVGPEMQLLKRVLQCAQGGQIVADKATWELMIQEEENETLEEEDERTDKKKKKRDNDDVETLEQVLPSKVSSKVVGRFHMETSASAPLEAPACGDHAHEDKHEEEDHDHITLLQVLPKELAERHFNPTEFASIKTGDDQKKEILDKLETLSQENSKLKEEVEKTKGEFDQVVTRASALVDLFKENGVSTEIDEDSDSTLALELKQIYEQQVSLRDDLALTRRKSEATMQYIKRLNDDLKSANFDSQLMGRKFKQISSIHKECGETIMKLRARNEQLASLTNKKKTSIFSKIRQKIKGEKEEEVAAPPQKVVQQTPSRTEIHQEDGDGDDDDDDLAPTETLNPNKLEAFVSQSQTDAPTESVQVEYPTVKTGVLEGADEIDFENYEDEAEGEKKREAEPSVSSPPKESQISTAQVKIVTPRDDASAASSDISAAASMAGAPQLVEIPTCIPPDERSERSTEVDKSAEVPAEKPAEKSEKPAEEKSADKTLAVPEAVVPNKSTSSSNLSKLTDNDKKLKKKEAEAEKKKEKEREKEEKRKRKEAEKAQKEAAKASKKLK